MYLGLVVDGSEAVKKLENSQDFALNEYRGDDSGGCPVSSARRHLKEPLLKRKLANLSHAAVPTPKECSHNPRYELEKGDQGSPKVLEELVGLEDTIDGTENALAYDGRSKSRVIMMIFVCAGNGREDWKGHQTCRTV